MIHRSGSSRDKDREAAGKAWENYTFAQKARYIWSYYSRFIVIGLIAASLIVYMLISPGKNKSETLLSVIIIDSPLTEEETKEMTDDLADAIGADPSAVTFVTFSSKDSSGEGLASAAAYIRSRRADLLIAGEERFNLYAVSGWLKSLKSAADGTLTGDVSGDRLFFAARADYTSAGPKDDDDIIFAPHSQEGGAECYGIYLEGEFSGEYCLGIPANCPDAETAALAAERLKQDY